MAKTRLYIVRHGKTMFNALGRAQGWCDTPLTKAGELGIHELGLGLMDAGLTFDQAYSSDSGRTIQTMKIILEKIGRQDICYQQDPRIREWCFGSLDGAYDAELFEGLLQRIHNVSNFQTLSYEALADGLVELDTADWAQPWEVLKKRIWEGFLDISCEIENLGGGNALVVSHGMTIGTFLYLIGETQPHSVMNGSVTIVSYEKGRFIIETIGDMSYRERGRELMKEKFGTYDRCMDDGS